jgi:DNA-binding HxlR family transcriptional regulator
MPHITEKVLIQQLKQLEADELIERKAKPVVPPHVTYTLTEAGIALYPVLHAMAAWAVDDSHRNTLGYFKNMSGFPLPETSRPEDS